MEVNYNSTEGTQEVEITHEGETYVGERAVGSGDAYEFEGNLPTPVRVRAAQINPENIRGFDQRPQKAIEAAQAAQENAPENGGNA